MDSKTRLLLVSTIVLLYFASNVPGQKQKHIIGDISEQIISNVAGLDERYQDKDRYRRKPTYLVQASKIVRPSTIYQVVVYTLEEAKPMRVRAALSRDGVDVHSQHVNMSPDESAVILLQVPPGNNVDSIYKLRVEGAGIGQGALIFENETMLAFSRQFLSVSISTNRAIYNGGQTIMIRALMMDTAGKPYNGIADLFIYDPDGYNIRKWNSKELNVGVLSGEFVLPEYPKVGFWKIKTEAQGQVNEQVVKVEKYYEPKFEVYVRMPTFVQDSAPFVEADVSGFYPWEKTVRGDINLRWFAKKIDYTTPMYNDSVLYRDCYAYHSNVSNTYTSNLYDNREGIPIRNHTGSRYGTRNPYYDPYTNSTFDQCSKQFKPMNWTYIRSDRYQFRQYYDRKRPDFGKLGLNEIQDKLGVSENVQVRAEAWITDFFYNNTQRGFCETRIINQTLSLKFIGTDPMVFKPGMPFEAQVAVRYSDQVGLTQDLLERSTLVITATATLGATFGSAGERRTLPEIKVPAKLKDISGFQDVDRLKHYNQAYGQEAIYDVENHDEINFAAYITDDIEQNTRRILELHAQDETYKEYREKGVHRFKIDVPENTRQLTLNAYYSDFDSGNAFAETIAYGAYSPKDRYIHVRSSNRDIRVGEYAVFHVKSNFALSNPDWFDWIILSKNIILKTGREYVNDIHAVTTTFSVVVSSEMAPGFHIMINYHLRPDDYLLSDSAYYPVQAINRHKMEFHLNQIKDHQKNTVEATVRGDPGSVFLSSTVRSAVYATQGKNLITKRSILESLHTFEDDQRHVHAVYFTDREGSKPDEVYYYPSMDYGIDTNRSFELKQLLVFTDSTTFIPQTLETRECRGEFLPCLQTGCYTKDQICDGRRDCTVDGFDESNCGDPDQIKQEQTLRFRLSRFNRYVDYYDWDGDWGWFTRNIDEDKESFRTLEIPLTTDDWTFLVFSYSKQHGIGFIDNPIEFSSMRPIHFYCEGPSEVHRGESVGIRCMIMNRSPVDLEVNIVLKGSADYKFIAVEEYGYVVSYAPRLESGDKHHYIYVRKESETEVHLPIAPQVEQGQIEVNIELDTQIMQGQQTVSIEILPEGSVVHRHTSSLLDLKSRAVELEFMDIIVDEQPQIPYEVFRRYVAGSPRAEVSICGDVIGPAFPNNEPVILERMFPTGHGRHGKGTEYHAFNLAANTWQLHYYRLTNQLQENWDLAKRVFEQMNVEYAGVMRRFSSQGWVSNWDESKPNVWLTAHVVRIFSHVGFQDWEDYIYIHPDVTGSAVMWLINYQTVDDSINDGCFSETEYYSHGPLHKPMEGKSLFKNEEHLNIMRNISLTAHVLIALKETAKNLQGDLKKYSAAARQRAVRFLERHLRRMEDPYELAIVAYALAISGSSEADEAYKKMFSKRYEEGGMVYWSRTKITTNNVSYEFNRPFLQPKSYQVNDALAVEATAYALLTMFKIEGGGVTIVQDQIVRWLNTMRLGDGGFISTVDTIMALEALVTYSYNSRIKDITDLNVNVQIPDSNITKTFHITGNKIAELRTLEIPNVWGHINFEARGAGQAIAQLDVNYGVDYEPKKDHPATPSFNLDIKERFHGRNKSEITIESCFNWTDLTDGKNSGMAMLVVDIPSGYIMLQPDANKLVRNLRKRNLPELVDADVTKPGKTIWYFDHVSSGKMKCFTHMVRRYYPVANLTRTRQAVIVEALRPERFFVRTFNATSLYILSICEVCGSYQCPYCPFYSSATFPTINWAMVLILTTLTLIVNTNSVTRCWRMSLSVR